MGVIQYGIVILSLTLFLIPVSQADAIFLVPIEISEEQFSKNYKEQQKLLAEKIRDYYFEKYLKIPNPYIDDTFDNTISSEQKFNMPSSIDRYDENFQTLKNEQLDLAHKKYMELMGGKIITNSFDTLDTRIIPTLEFTEEEEKILQTIHREDEDFKSYKIKQKIFAENTVKKLIQELWEEDPFVVAKLFEDYYYNSEKDIESISAALELIDEGAMTAEELIEQEVISSKDLIQDNVISASNLKAFWATYEPEENSVPTVQETLPEDADFDWKDIEWKKNSRSSEEFQNLMTEQAALAKNTRDKEITFLPQLNPYDENDDTVSIQENNQTETIQEIFVELEPIIERDDEEFLQYKLEQVEKAKLFFKNYYRMDNSDMDDVASDPITEKQSALQKIIDRYDELFKLKIQSENDKAQEKILELLGGKNIHN